MNLFTAFFVDRHSKGHYKFYVGLLVLMSSYRNVLKLLIFSNFIVDLHIPLEKILSLAIVVLDLSYIIFVQAQYAMSSWMLYILPKCLSERKNSVSFLLFSPWILEVL